MDDTKKKWFRHMDYVYIMAKIHKETVFYLDAVIVKVGDDDIVVTVNSDEMRAGKLMTTHSTGAEFVNQSSIGSIVNKNLSEIDENCFDVMPSHIGEITIKA